VRSCCCFLNSGQGLAAVLQISKSFYSVLIVVLVVVADIVVVVHAACIILRQVLELKLMPNQS